jgi:aryl-alcohol dehydrogenase-like predicted oxidoreductase
MEYSLFSRDAEEQGQIDACKELGMAMMAYAVLGRGMLSDQVPKMEELAADDVRQRLPRFQSVNIMKNLGLRSTLEAIARRKNVTLAQLSIAWPMAQGKRAEVFLVPIPGAKSLKHIEENARAADIVLTTEDLAELDSIVPPGAACGTRYPIGQLHRLNV